MMHRSFRRLYASVIAVVTIASPLQVAWAFAGADVILSGIPDVSSHGAVGGVRAYTLGSDTCNIGNTNVEWINGGPPGLAMNAYRLHDGRLMQIGMSWVKTACCAANFNDCGMPSCTGGRGTALGVGCRDTYHASWNSIQTRMGPRSMFNAYAGTFTPGIPPGTFTAISRRMQVAEGDLNPANFPGATYFVEGVYVSQNDALNGNWLNNASYQRATFSAGFVLSLAADEFVPQDPAIEAWQAHGNGVNIPDPTVQIVDIQVPDEGHFTIATKVRDNGDGTWRYDYAVFNLNSHRSGGSLRIPVPAGVTVTDIGFHDVDYHSGEIYDNTDWTATRLAADVLWASPQTFAQNQNSNALRWGTMYNYWYTANSPPQSVQATLGLFRPGPLVDSIMFTTQGPTPVCRADVAPDQGDGTVGVPDLLAVINSWGACGKPCPTDIAPEPSGDGTVGVPDLLAIINAWGPCN